MALNCLVCFINGHFSFFCSFVTVAPNTACPLTASKCRFSAFYSQVDILYASILVNVADRGFYFDR